MPWQVTAFFAASVFEWAMLLLVRGRLRTNAAGPFSLALILNALWALSYGCELLAPTLEDKQYIFQIRCSFLCFYAPAWLETVHRMTQGRPLLRGWTLAAALLVPVISLLLIWLPGPGQNTFLRHSFWLDTAGDVPVLRNSLGPWGVIYYGYTYAVWTALFILVAPRKHQTPHEWRGRLLFLTAGLIGVATDVSHHFGITSPPGLNYTPMLFPLTSSLMAIALLRHRMLDLAPVARAALIEQLEDGIIVLDDETRVVDFNRSAATTLSLTANRTLGRRFDELVSVFPELAALPERPENQRCEVILGADTFEISLFSVEGTGATANARVMVMHNITRRKETERQLRIAKEAAEAAGEARSRFLATMSHEIRTPMNGVVGFTQLLMDTPLNEEQRDYLNLIDQSSRTLLVIINDVLDYSKIAADQLEIEEVPCVVSSIVDHASRIFIRAANEKGISLTTYISPDVPESVISDPVRLSQILSNLLSNAVKFTSEGGVTLSVEWPGPGLLVFRVADTGIGIPEDQQTRIFTPFSQADASTTRRFGGTGLGLSISRRLCELMDGALTVTSAPGQGSVCTAVVRVKPASPPPAPVSVTASDISLATTSGLRILVCEDNAVNQAVVRAILQRLGHAFRLTANGVEALAALESEPFDVVILDIEMPVMDGYETARRIRKSPTKRIREIHLLALTAHALKGEHERCLAVGMDGFLTKPLSIPALVEALSKVTRSSD